MKAKKIILTASAILAAGALTYGAVKWTEEQRRLKSQQEIVRVVRDFFEDLGEIATVYVELYASGEEYLQGGVVMEDGRHFTFCYEQGELTYEEEDR